MFSNVSNTYLPQLFWLPLICGVLWKILSVLNKINENLSNQNSPTTQNTQNTQNLAKVKKDKSEQFCPFCFATIPISAVKCKFCDKNLSVSWPIS